MRVVREPLDGPVWRVRLEPGAGADAVSFDGDGLAQLDALLVEAEGSTGCRVIVIESQAGVFCRGMDLAFLVARAGEDLSDRLLAYARCMERLRASARVIVVLVDGEASGGGVGLAAAADLTIATAGASFSLPEAVFGLMPAMVLPLLCERMSAHEARWLALSSRKLGPEQALELGLIDELVSDADALERSLRRHLKQLLRASPRALARIKRHTDELAGLTRAEALELGARRTAEDLREPATMAALEGFMAGESPPWFERYRAAERAGKGSES